MCTYYLDKNAHFKYIVGVEPGECDQVMLVDEAAYEMKVGMYVLMSHDGASWLGDC